MIKMTVTINVHLKPLKYDYIFRDWNVLKISTFFFNFQGFFFF